MDVESTFSDERSRAVRSRIERPVLDVDTAFDSGDTATVSIPNDATSRLLYLISSLELGSGVYSTTALIKDGVTTEHTLRLVPGEAQVLPLDDGGDYSVEITSNAPSLGSIRVLVVAEDYE